MRFEEAGVKVGLKVAGGLDDDKEGLEGDGGSLGLVLKEDAEVTEDKRDGVEEEGAGLGRAMDGFKEYEGA